MHGGHTGLREAHDVCCARTLIHVFGRIEALWPVQLLSCCRCIHDPASYTISHVTVWGVVHSQTLI